MMRKNFFLRWLGNVIVVLGSIIASLFSVEFLLAHHVFTLKPTTPQGYVDTAVLAKQAAAVRRVAYDGRTLYAVIMTERKQGKRAFPAASPAYFLSDDGSSVKIDGKAVLPMGITASANNFYCNESGKFVDFVTDQFGFRNAKTDWHQSVDIIAVGDSYTMGSCLDNHESIVGRLRSAGQKVLNFGMGANGPLIELGSLVEYGRGKKPKTVLWFFFPNDIADLERDYKNIILKKYLNKNFSQHLMPQASRLNTAVDEVIETYWHRIEAAEKAQTDVPSTPFYRLPQIKQLYLFTKNQWMPSETKKNVVNLNLLKRVFQRANDETRAMGAKLYFVYLPDCIDSSYGQNQWKPTMLRMLESLKIPIIDTEKTLTEMQKKGEMTYFYCPGSHFNPRGAKAVADLILEKLEQKKNVVRS